MTPTLPWPTAFFASVVVLTIGAMFLLGLRLFLNRPPRHEHPAAELEGWKVFVERTAHGEHVLILLVRATSGHESARVMMPEEADAFSKAVYQEVKKMPPPQAQSIVRQRTTPTREAYP